MSGGCLRGEMKSCAPRASGGEALRPPPNPPPAFFHFEVAPSHGHSLAKKDMSGTKVKTCTHNVRKATNQGCAKTNFEVICRETSEEKIFEKNICRETYGEKLFKENMCRKTSGENSSRKNCRETSGEKILDQSICREILRT